MICLAVLGQVTASLLLDQYGVLQAPKPVDAVRIVGALLVLAGVVLVVAPWRKHPAQGAPAPPASTIPGVRR
jgi:transporter family-2 protein